MLFTPTPEQQQLGEMVQRFLGEQYGFGSRRKILDSREGWSRETWSKLAELGLLSLQVPEEQGGMAPAVVETLLTATATGAAMLLEPWVSSAIIATVLIRELGSAQQREEMLVPMAAGERIAVPAHFEPDARYDLQRVATSARRQTTPAGHQADARSWTHLPYDRRQPYMPPQSAELDRPLVARANAGCAALVPRRTAGAAIDQRAAGERQMITLPEVTLAGAKLRVQAVPLLIPAAAQGAAGIA